MPPLTKAIEEIQTEGNLRSVNLKRSRTVLIKDREEEPERKVAKQEETPTKTFKMKKIEWSSDTKPSPTNTVFIKDHTDESERKVVKQEEKPTKTFIPKKIEWSSDTKPSESENNVCFKRNFTSREENAETRNRDNRQMGHGIRQITVSRPIRSEHLFNNTTPSSHTPSKLKRKKSREDVFDLRSKIPRKR